MYFEFQGAAFQKKYFKKYLIHVFKTNKKYSVMKAFIFLSESLYVQGTQQIFQVKLQLTKNFKGAFEKFP